MKNTSSLALTCLFLLGTMSLAYGMKEEEISNNPPKLHQKEKFETSFENQKFPIGSVIPFAGDINSLPQHNECEWLLCDGQGYSSLNYPELYEVIKENYIPMSMSWKIQANKEYAEKKFHVPDLRGRVIVGVDDKGERITSNNKLGESGGEEKHRLTIEELANHNLEIPAPSGNGNGVDVNIGRSFTGSSVITKSTGGDQPHNNMQPYQVLNYIIYTGKKQNEKVSQIQEQKELSALFNNKKLKQFEWKEVEWGNFHDWIPLKFTTFVGNEKLKAIEDSTIEIPEDGLYSLCAYGQWKANKSENSTAALGIGWKHSTQNRFVPYYMTRNTVIAGGEATHNVSKIVRLKKGQKFNILLKSDKRVEYTLYSFGFEIEKIN